MFECDLYWSGEVGYGTSITLETGRDDWRGQTKHKVSANRAYYDIIIMCVYAFEMERGIIISDFIQPTDHFHFPPALLVAALIYF